MVKNDLAISNEKISKFKRGYLWILGLICIVLGLWLAYRGSVLLSLGGSSYYVIAGVFLLLCGLLLWIRRIFAAYLYAVFFVGTIVWAIFDAGFTFWPLAARTGFFGVLGFFIALSVPLLKGARVKKGLIIYSRLVAFVLFIAVGGAFFHAFEPIWLTKADQVAKGDAQAPLNINNDAKNNDGEQNWVGLGRTPQGTQFAPFDQINRDNVKDLKVAWTMRTGDVAIGGKENQNTPLQIGNTIYACTPSNQVFALNIDTGKQLWHFDPKVSNAYSPTWQRCRSLAYYEAKDNLGEQNGACQKSIYVATADLRLIALNADTGALCQNFGENGSVDLTSRMGKLIPGFYNPTTGPVLAGRLLLLGGWVMDNQSTDEPSGVVRAFDAETGKLVWAYDPAKQDDQNANIDNYTRSSPNMWAAPSYDQKLDMVYLPMGNGTPDMFGGYRSAQTDRISSSVVALDAKTGKEKWVFQTTHHDVWDYDLPSKPVLYDMPDGKGGTLPALIQTTKRGEIFVLNRETGVPLSPVEERKVPIEGVEGEHLSPTQPYSVGMPQIRQGELNEKMMWGITPLDQLECRISFKSLRYEGDFTPPSTDWYLFHPAPAGSMNWGGVSIDPVHNYLIVNDMRVMMKARLIEREKVAAATTASGKVLPGTVGVLPMDGTPYGADRDYVMSPIGVLCNNPPYGAMTAIDLNNKQIVWQRSMGTVKEFGPMGRKTHMPIEIGMPTLGGPVATSGGLIFFAGTSDYFLRAMDINSGEEVWKSPLPVGGQATPLVGVSPDSGKQYIIIHAGGTRGDPIAVIISSPIHSKKIR